MLSGPDIVSNIAIRHEPWAKRGIPTTRNHHCLNLPSLPKKALVLQKCSFKQKTLQTLKNRTWTPLISNPCWGGSPLFNLRSFCGNLRAFCGILRAFCKFPPLAQEDFSVQHLEKMLVSLKLIQKCSFHQKTLRNSKKCSFPWFARKKCYDWRFRCFTKSTVYTPSQFDPTSRTCFQLPALSCPPTNASQGNNHIADITKSQLELLGHCVVSSCPLPTVLSTHAQQDQLSEVKMSSIIASQLGIVVLRSASLLPILQKVKCP